MPSDPAVRRPSRLADQVQHSLESRIDSGVLSPGDRLPTEHELAQAHGVSRAVVREAMSRLKADGRIFSRQGLGAFVSKRPTGTALRLMGAGDAFQEPDVADSPGMLARLMEVRGIVESACAALAAERHGQEDLRAIREALDAMQASIDDGTDGASADDRFHRAVARATGNPYLQQLVEFLSAQFNATRRPGWAQRDLKALRQAQQEHARLLAAIEAGDAAASRRLAAQHLERSARRLAIALPDPAGDAASGALVPDMADEPRSAGA